MKPIKVGFILASNSQRPLASTRIFAHNMFPYLRAANYDPCICFEPDINSEKPEVSGLAERLNEQGIEIAVFQKVHGSSVLNELNKLAASRTKTIFSTCDYIDIAMSRATDATIVVTDYLKSLYPPELQPKTRVIHDGIERPDVFKTSWRADRGSRTNLLRAVLVSSDPLQELPLIVDPPEWLEVEIVGSYSPMQKRLQRVREARWTLSSRKGFHESMSYLRFLTNRRIRRVAWNPVGVYESLKRADIGIIPINTSPGPEEGESSPRWKVKSENRLTLKMAVGLPVIATPIPAYEPVMEHGRSGFFARSQDDWIECLDALRDPKRRRTVGDRARESVLTKYSKEEQARLLIEVLRKVSESCAASPGLESTQPRRS